MEPRFVELPAFSVVGMSDVFTGDGSEGIAALWERSATRWIRAARPFPEKSYGLCYPEPAAEGQEEVAFRYVAGYEAVENPPEGLEPETVPANRYAVFTHQGDVYGISSAYECIFRTWMPTSGYRRAQGPSFEYYDDRFDAETLSGEIDIYVPIAATG
jgi:AraC family transcriptional regulator